MDFLAPQPFNVEIGPEPDAATEGVAGPSVPVAAQEITPDAELYPRTRRGVIGTGIIE